MDDLFSLAVRTQFRVSAILVACWHGCLFDCSRFNALRDLSLFEILYLYGRKSTFCVLEVKTAEITNCAVSSVPLFFGRNKIYTQFSDMLSG